MLCTNAMVVDAWKVNPYPEYVDCQDGILEAEEGEDKVADNIPTYPPRKSSSLTRSSSCNRINLPLSNRKPKRSLSTSGTQRPQIKQKYNTSPAKIRASSTDLTSESSPFKGRLSRSNSLFSRLASRHPFSRSRRSSSTSSKEMDLPEDNTTVVTKDRRRRRNKTSKKDAKLIPAPARLLIPRSRSSRGHSPDSKTSRGPQANGGLPSSPDSVPNSPSHYKTAFTVSPPTPDELHSADSRPSLDLKRATSLAASADESPLPSPPLEDKSYDSGRMSMSSFRSFSSGRPTSMSSVTSSISSRTSRGSDYFSSASSGGQDQITSHRIGLQTVLPDLNESESSDRLGVDTESGDVENDAGHQSKRTNSARNSRSSAFVAHDRNNRDLNDVDHLAPVANLAMVVNPDLSYVDRVILELIETERMYVRSMRDILTGYLSVIRSNPGLNIPLADVDDLFGNIRDLYDFNRNLLSELEDCQGDPLRIAECFVSRDDDYKVYTEYCTNYPTSVAAMTRCMKNSNLVDFFKEQQDYLRHTLPLGSYLLKPVQRVLKYHLLLQELVKHCDKKDDGYQTIEKALQTMTRVARHINEMKRKHEDAVHIQEIQSSLTNWQGSELTTYGELILESEMKMQGAKNERQVFLFEKMILITKRREDGFLVCKVNIMCSELVMLESVPNMPLGFQIQAHEHKSSRKSSERQASGAQPDSIRAPCCILLAPNQDEKDLWTYNIKQRIIKTLLKAVPCDARDRLLRPVRDGDGEGNLEEEKMAKKLKSRYGSNTKLGNQDSKPAKYPLTRLTSNPSSTSLPSANQMKNRRRSDSMSRKTLHKKALQKRKDEIESSDDISADSSPNTPSGVKVTGKFSFPGFRQSTRPGSGTHTNKITTTPAKSNHGKANGDLKKSLSMKPAEFKKSTSNDGGEVTKRHHNSVIYRRHKRRTSQPITYTEKRLSMKLTEEEGESKTTEGEKLLDEEDFLNFNPLTARESVSWDIQIVEAVFERYKNEDPSKITSPDGPEKQTDLESTYLTVSSDVAPTSVKARDHTPTTSERRKSRIVVVPSSDSSGDEKEAKKQTRSVPPVLRRRKSKGFQTNKRTSGVVYTVSQELDVESDSGLNQTKSLLRKVVQASENARKSLVIHESDTEVETNQILIEKASTVRRKSSLKRKERNARRRLQSGNNTNDNNNNVPQNTNTQNEIANRKRRPSLYDNIGERRQDYAVKAAAVTSSVQSMSTATISMVDSKSQTTTVMTTVQSATPTTVVSTTVSSSVVSQNSNSNNNAGLTNRPIIKNKNTIPTGKVRGLIERLRGNSSANVIVVSSNTRKTPLTSPTFSLNPKEAFSFAPKTITKSCDTAKTNQIAGYNSNAAKRVVTTESLQLTLTSSSESEDEAAPTIAQRVKRQSIHETDASLDDAKKQHQIFLRRTFSQDVNSTHTRRTTNLQLESRISGEFAPNDGPSRPAQEQEEYKFEGVESGDDAKHYLFEKLCLGPPGESKVTDKMSEEFEHVCSDLENNRLNSMDSHAFSTSDEEKSVTAKIGKFLRRDLATRLSKRELIQTDSNLVENPDERSGHKDLDTTDAQSKMVKPIIGSVDREIAGTQPCGRSTLPNRADSLRSTKSEYLSSRRDLSSTRGRSSTSRHRGPSSQLRLPAKDMHAIPQRNVARLAKKFDENSTPTEKQRAITPRRSKSVGGAERMKKRLQERQEMQKKKELNAEKELPFSPRVTSDTPNIASSNGGRELKTPKRETMKSRLEKAEIKMEEVEFCHSTDYSAKLLKATSTEEELVVSPTSVGDDDVFRNALESPAKMTTSPAKITKSSTKKKSLIEMFAVVPQGEEGSKTKDIAGGAVRDFKPLNLDPPCSNSVRVVLVRTPDEDGRDGFEPKVMNSPSSTQRKESETPKILEKRKSWSSLSPTSEGEPKRRTRLRSSSFTRARMRAAMSPKS